MVKKKSAPDTEASTQGGSPAGAPHHASLLDKVTAEVTPEVSPLLSFITNNATRIVLVFVLFLVAGVGYGAYQWNVESTLNKARADLGAIEVLQDASVRLAALEKFVPEAPVEIAAAANLALAKAALEGNEFEKAAAAWECVASSEKGAFLVVAIVGQAEALARGGKEMEALALLQKHQGVSSDVSRALIDSLIVGLAEKNKNYAVAIAASESLATNPINAGESDLWRQKAVALRAAEKAL